MQAEAQIETNVNDGRADFDFLFGNWHLSCRRLRERLKGSTSWEEFDGHFSARPLLGGLANIDEGVFNRASGPHIGLTVRLFDVSIKQWRIYWADGTRGLFDVPMIGSFVNGRGEFYAQELFEGRAIFSRFIWTVLSPDACRWEQAFSEDGGQTWETNWVNDFTRIP